MNHTTEDYFTRVYVSQYILNGLLLDGPTNNTLLCFQPTAHQCDGAPEKEPCTVQYVRDTAHDDLVAGSAVVQVRVCEVQQTTLGQQQSQT
jgi:hypothetical protein